MTPYEQELLEKYLADQLRGVIPGRVLRSGARSAGHPAGGLRDTLPATESPAAG